MVYKTDDGPGFVVGDVLAYFFIPLPEPIGLPVDIPFPFTKYEDVEATVARAIAGGDPDPLVDEMVSLRVHRGVWTQPLGGIDNYVVARVEQVLPWLTSPSGVKPGPLPDDGTPLPEVTLVEAAVLVDPDDDDAMTQAFDLALERIHALQQAYFISTRTPTTLVRRESLPMAIAHAVAEVTDGGLVERSGITLFMCNMNLPNGLTEVDLHDPTDQFAQALHRTLNNDFMSPYFDATRDAQVAHYLRGEFRSAAIHYATASEALLQNVLLYMLWEERRSPAEGVAEYFRPGNGLRNRLKQLYAPRLKGAWRFDKPGPLQTWDRDTANLRHRAVHAGYLPTAAECAASEIGVRALTAFIADRLASTAVIGRYPRTAVATVGIPRLEDRGVWNGRIRRLTEDTEQPIWHERFNRWREVWTMLAREHEGQPLEAPDPARARTLLVVDRIDITWVIHDRATRRASVITPAEGTDVSTIEETARKIAAVRESADNPGPFAVPVAGEVAVTDAEEWVWDFELVPDVGHGLA